MPQDKRRSISYRSFIRCDDPKGIECGAITKSKINSQKGQQDNTKIGNDNQNTFVPQNVVKEDIETNNSVTLKLLDVSKEAYKLNHFINSWSNDNKSKENQKNNITKGLLKRTADLQESLFMLGKLQEPSGFMLGVSEREKQKLEGATFGGMVSVIRGFERSSIDLNGRYRRKFVDEMRNVVRDKKLMTKNPVFGDLDDYDYDYDQKKMESHDMLPSTSSSQSPMVYSSKFAPSDSSISSSNFSPWRKGEESNLIVKLMGLDSFPSPGAKRPQFGAKDVGMRQRSVEEILEKSKFKGVVRNSLLNPCLDIKVSCIPKFCVENMKKKNIRGSYKVKSCFNWQQRKSHKEQVEVKKGSEVEKVTQTRRKGEEKEDGKSIDHLSDRDQEKCTTLKNQRKSDGKYHSKIGTSNEQKMTSTSMLDDRKLRTSELKKNRKQALVIEEKQVWKHEKKESELINEDSETRGKGNSGNHIITGSISIDDDEKERCQIPIQVHHDADQERAETLNKSINAAMKTPRRKLKSLIFSNKICVNHIEELFNIQVNEDLVPYVIDDGDDQDLESPNLLIDCAKEVLELKRLRFSQACLLLPRTLDCVLEEVCSGIEDLRCYYMSTYHSFASDNLYVLLDRDLRLKSGIWGVGWRRMYSRQEIEQVICEIDTFVLSKLIEETLLDFFK